MKLIRDAGNVRRYARAAGFEAYRHARPYVRRLPAFATQAARSTSFTIALDEATTFVGFSYHRDGWNPHVETLKSFEAEPSLTYQQSPLFRTHEQFRPSNLQELLVEDATRPLRPLDSLPLDRRLFRYIWVVTPATIREALRDPRPRGHHYFGPLTTEQGLHQFDRGLAAYRSIRRDGFRPDLHEPVRGYFLVAGTERRFVVTGGNHRLAVMRVLGHEQVTVELSRTHPAVIDRSDLERWGRHRGGIFVDDAAHVLFDKLFHENGMAKARALGLT